MSVQPVSLLVRCLFRLGTPPQPFAVVENTATGKFEVVQIAREVFDFFRVAGIPLCQPVTVPPGSLLDVSVVCVFEIFIGAQDLIRFAVGEEIDTGEIVIVQIPPSVFDFYRSQGVPLCMPSQVDAA